MLELDDFEIVEEDEFNWVMVKGGGMPFLLPKKGARVAVDVTLDIIHKKACIGIGRYLTLLEETGGVPGQ